MKILLEGICRSSLMQDIPVIPEILVGENLPVLSGSDLCEYSDEHVDTLIKMWIKIQIKILQSLPSGKIPAGENI